MAGIEIFVCGWNLASDNVDPKLIPPDVTAAGAAIIALKAFRNGCYALRFF